MFFASENLSDLVEEEKEAKPKILCPEGTFSAVVRGVFDIGYETYQGKTTDKVYVCFEINKKMPAEAGEFAGLRFNINKRMAKKISSKNCPADRITDLSKLIFACTGSNEVPQDFKLADLVELTLLVTVKHKKNDNGNTYANIISMMPRMEDTPMLDIEKPYTAIPDWILKVKAENEANRPKAITEAPQRIEPMKPRVTPPKEADFQTIETIKF
jgi:hypothetical protein